MIAGGWVRGPGHSACWVSSTGSGTSVGVGTLAVIATGHRRRVALECGSILHTHWDWCRFGGRQGTQRWGVCDAVSPTFPAAWPTQGEAGPVALGGQRGAARSRSPVLAAPLSPVPGALLPPRGGVRWCFPDTRAHSPWAGGTGGSCLVVRRRLGGTAKVGGQKRASWSTFWFHFT